MDDCAHTNLTVLHDTRQKLRCRHCHLTITADELPDEFCPECYEATGYKNYDFDVVEKTGPQPTRYRCEECGMMIEDE